MYIANSQIDTTDLPRHADPSPMAYLSDNKYELLIEAFRRDPGNVGSASKFAGVNYRTARQAWEQGYLARGKDGKRRPARQSIKEFLAAEREEKAREVRSEALRLAYEEREINDLIKKEADRVVHQKEVKEARKEQHDVGRSAIIQKAAEQKASEALLASTSYSLSQLHKTAGAMSQLMDRVTELVLKDAADEDLTLKELWGTFERYVRVQEKVANMLNTSVSMTRKVAGEPDHTVQVVNGPASDLSPTDAEELGMSPREVVEAITSLMAKNPNDNAKRLIEHQRMKTAAAAQAAKDQSTPTKH